MNSKKTFANKTSGESGRGRLVQFIAWLSGSSDVGFWPLLLHRFNDFLANVLNVYLGQRAGRCSANEAIYDAFEDTDAEFGVDDGIGKIDASNGKSHDDPFGLIGDGSGRYVSLGPDVPRVRIFFESSRCKERRHKPKNERDNKR